MIFDLSPELLSWLGLAALFVMSFIGASPIPIPFPLTVTILWLAQVREPVVVIAVATVGTLAGWSCLETVFRRWSQRPRIQNSVPVAYQRFFLKQTGWWLFFFNALPFPWDPMRLLALLNDYPRQRFLAILGMSRAIRNTILVTIGGMLAPSKLLFWAVLILFLLLPFAANWLMRQIFTRFQPPQDAQPPVQPRVL